ncbi:MAG: transcription termination/antitermination protein NusG [Prevotella sp.]|nr:MULTISPECIES: transcription termination/antitermination protein NusG [unclassified Prevotella]MCH3969676.1 transcription termination/antitermination protein NusG [Prevotella sp.]MCH3985057.1 transcription termination/antitermination protein NusG [Prevotella sp.]MCH3992752.1 transcription termination/antitermination protein NusG [Prevotella sp.]MCH4019073.1 transcription termination/antitermination protein NusG [Prevotella sp.]MCH4099333.1 transcription termination/antitermination protein Nu
MAESKNNWYVLKVVSGKEAKVKEYIDSEMKHNTLLSDHVAQVMIPTEKHASIRAGKRVVKEKISMPGYAFVQADLGENEEVASALRFMPNVLGVLGGLEHPSPVSQSEINRMLGTAENTEFEDNDAGLFTVDETVKVIDGPFSGFSGVIDEVNAGQHKLKVMVKIFGRKTPLELSFNQVEKE